MHISSDQYNIIYSAIFGTGGYINEFSDNRSLAALKQREYIAVRPIEDNYTHGFRYQLTYKGIRAIFAYIVHTFNDTRSDLEIMRIVPMMLAIPYIAKMYKGTI